MKKLKDIFKLRKYRKRFVSVFLTIVLILSGLPLDFLADQIGIIDRKLTVLAAGTGPVRTFTSIDAYEDYVDEYNADPSSHTNDVLKFTFSGNSTNLEFDCGSIGLTEAAAFNGKIIIGTGVQFHIKEPMFKYVTDDVEIVDLSGSATTMVFTRPRPGSNKSLFAEYVVSRRTSGDPVEWNLGYAPYSQGGKRYVYDFAGYLGTLKSGAKVKISSVIFNNLGVDASGVVHANISANALGDAGLICCTMESSSELEIDSITFQSSGTVDQSFSITASSSGNAGGLVGSMGAGSKLSLADTLQNIQTADAEITASNGYAGGIVGKCDGGYVCIVAGTGQALGLGMSNNSSQGNPSDGKSVNRSENSDDDAAKKTQEDDGDKAVKSSLKGNEVSTDGDEADGSGTEDGDEADGSGTEDGDEADGSGTEDGDEADGSETEDGDEADGSGMEDGDEADGSETEDGDEADGSETEDGDEADGSETEDGDEADGSKTEDGDEADGSETEDGDEADGSGTEDGDEAGGSETEENGKAEDGYTDYDSNPKSAPMPRTAPGESEGEAAVSASYVISQIITGKTGAGGIAGYYRATTDNLSVNATITTSFVDLSTGNYKVNGAGACGGLFGEVFNNGTNMTVTVDGELKPDHTSSTAASYGGLMGKYYASAQTLSLTVSGTALISPKRTGETGAATNYGGVIGVVDTYTPSGGSKTSAYVKINGITVDSKNAKTDGFFGGVIAKADEAFIELSVPSGVNDNKNKISYSGIDKDKNFAGVVGSLETGVLYLCDGTDLTGAQSIADATAKSGQIVGYRNCGFVFAKSGWKLYRSSNGQRVDDIGSWGEVIRFNDTNFVMNNVISFDPTSTNHCVTIKKRSETNNYHKNIAGTEDFAILALNVQHNSGTDGNVLKFEDKNDFTSAKILTKYDISINTDATIDLSGTGITGLTRDNSYNGTDTTSYLEFKGSSSTLRNMNGGNGTIILAIGEEYGETRSANYGNGTIYRHKYNGLIARTNYASFSHGSYGNNKLTITGTVNVNACSSDINVGSLVSNSTNKLQIDNVNCTTTINHSGSGTGFNVGGFVGKVGGDIVFCYNDKRPCSFNGSILGSSTGSSATVGGLIGCVDVGTFTSSIKDVTLSGTIKSEGNKDDQKIGGLIGVISSSNNASTGRTLTLKNVIVDGVEVNGAATNSSGGLLGYSWYKTDVVFGDGTNTGVEVKGTSKMVTTAKNATEMMYAATGYWNVNTNGIKISAATAEAESASDSFGVLINKGTLTGGSAIYLELARNGFVISSLTTSKLKSTVKVFDELVAYSKFDGTDILDNGQGIVSINTYDGTNDSSKLLKMGSSDTANTGVTYQRQTSFVPATYYNPNTRYYYNLNDYRTNSSNTPAAKLLMWSVYRYAHSSIQGYFPAAYRYADTSIGSSGANLDLCGYSYYPVDITTNTTIQGNAKLYNAEFDETENSTTCKRKSLETTPLSQHYTMHNSLFRNVKGNTTLTVSNFKLDGDVSIDGNGYCGALIMGTVEGKSSTEPAKVTINGLTLNGIKINGITSSSTAYAPLLINKSGSNATFTISNISAGTKTENSSTVSVYELNQVIGSSLMGDLGSSTATFVKVTFNSIKLDGRDDAGKGLDQLNSVYYTNRSLFSRATLLNSLAYADSSSYGTYYYSYSEDYDGDADEDGKDDKVGSVTYGKEIVGTVENRDNSSPSQSKQNKYSDGIYYTHPYESSWTSGEYDDFNTAKYQKYVYTDYNLTNKTHELRVNVSAASFTGCGTYNDPYIIVSGDNLDTIAKIINGTINNDLTFTITVPKSVTNSNQNCSWCNGEHTTFTLYDSSNQKWKNSGTDELSNDALRKYLAGAYYKIDETQTGDIVLPNSYEGLSNNVTDDGFVFHGVIDGSLKTIQNNSYNPLIVSSRGSVVENLTIEVSPMTTYDLTTNSKDLKFSRADGCEFYGAVMGQALGGDNIIDKVSVSFASTTPVINANKSTATFAQNVPIGGYVGVVVEGGVIFKNMSGTTHAGITSSALTGFGTGDDYSPLTDNKWLYVNPIIGRVINGYAVTEGSAYHWSETAGKRTDSVGVTMHNGTKNYSIADINPNLDKIVIEAITDETNSFNIKFPNAQSLFIMSLLTHSGITANSFTGVKHNADYDEIGSDADEDEDYANVTATQYPYIVKKYVSNVDLNSDSITDVMQLTTSGISCDFSLGGSDTVWYLPDGFKGIGSIGYGIKSIDNIESRTFSIHKLSGKNSYGTGNEIAIDLNMSASHYEDAFDNYLPLCTAASGSGNGGFGLFDKLRHNNQGSIEDDDKIIDLKLSGKIDYTVVQHGNDVEYTKANVEKPSYLHVGGIAGCIGSGANTDTDMIRVESIDIDGLEINGYESAGGFFGKLNMANTTTGSVNVSAVSADSFTITSKRYAGGLIGYFGQGNLTVDEISIKNPMILTVYVGDGSNQSVDFDNGAGGVIGFLQNVKTNNGAQISNITIGELGVTHNSRIGYPAEYTTAKNKDTLVAGGIIGRSYTNSNNDSVYSLIMDNCNVYNTNIYGYRVGGLFGCDSASKNAGTEANIKVINSKVKSDNNSILYGVIPADNKHRSCSGIVGSLRKNRGFLIENSSVEGYTIQGFNDTAGLCANDETVTTVHNFTIKDVTLVSNYSGSLLGWQGEAAKLYGYNILIDNVQFKDKDGGTSIKNEHGYIVAKNTTSAAKAADIKLVAFTRLNTEPKQGCFVPDRLVGITHTGNLGKNGYVIFADYDGKSQTGSKGTKFADINTTASFAGNSESPYVYTSPYATLSSNNGNPQIITSDGVSAASYGSSVAKNIIDDITDDESAKRYQNTGISQTDLSSLETTLTGKISSFEYELGKAGISTDSAHYTGGDFPVLVIDDISNVGTTVNNFIKLLSNTSYDYQTNISKSGVYSVEISKWKYNNGVFEKQSGEAALKYDTTRKEFYITTTEQDNVGYQFSLIDVQYKDPSSTSQTAYHLYIPVMVEKMLHYSFTVRPASGTTYRLDAYPNSETNLVENLGNPVTVKLTYTYNQASSDWAKAINTGENVLRNYDKKIMLKVTHASNATGIPSNAQFVLVDPNNNTDKMSSEAFATSSTSILEVTDSTSVGYTQYNLKLSGFTGFSMCNLNDLMKISTDSSVAVTDRKLVECTSSDSRAIVYINDPSDPLYTKYLRPKTSSDTGTPYAIKVSGWAESTFTELEENYYLSIFTKPDGTDNTIYHYEFDADTSFRTEGYPSARTNAETSHILLGNLYNNDVSIQETNTNSVISKSNNSLQATLTAHVGFRGTAISNEITSYIADNANVAIYQTFLVSLQKIKDNATSMGIVLSPECSFTYAVNGVAINDTEKKACKDLGFSVEFPTEHSIKDALCTAAGNWNGSNEDACKITITANVSMSYAKYTEEQLSNQFPESNGSDGNGTKMVGYSNLSSASDNGAASCESKNTLLTAGRRLYYMGDVQPVTLVYMVDDNDAFPNDGNVNFGQLGINSHSLAKEVVNGSSKIISLITYDASEYSLRRDARYLKVEMKLTNKASNYVTALDFDTYMKSFNLYDKNNLVVNTSNGYSVTKSGNVITYTIPITSVKRAGDDSYEFSVPVKFEVYSGEGQHFEDQNLLYSNYCVEATVSLLGQDQAPLKGSNATDKIKYTNAKIYRDVLPDPMPTDGSGGSEP